MNISAEEGAALESKLVIKGKFCLFALFIVIFLTIDVTTRAGENPIAK